MGRYWNTPQHAWGVGPKKKAKPRKSLKIHQALAAPLNDDSPSSPEEEEQGPQGLASGRQAAEPHSQAQGESSGSRDGGTGKRFSEFLQIHSEALAGATVFSQRQHEDPNLAQAWSSAVFDGEEQGLIS